MNHKFNAWDEETKHMYLAGNDHIVLDSDGTCYNLQTGNKLIPLFWTGKEDKNKKCIYLGDIIKVPSGCAGDYWVKENIGIVCYSFPTFYLNLIRDDFLPDDFWDDVEVIGNKYEQPELLNE